MATALLAKDYGLSRPAPSKLVIYQSHRRRHNRHLHPPLVYLLLGADTDVDALC